MQRAWFLAALLLLSSCVRSLSIQPTLIPGPPQAASAIPAPTFSPVPPAASPFAGVTASPAASQPPAAPPETATTGKPLPKEQPVVQIPLDGPAATQEAELTGMAWYSSTLILLPRDPARFADKLPESTPPADGAVFALDKAEILSFLDGASPGPLTPRLVPVLAPGLAQPVNGFTGFQAIAVQGERIFLTLAAKPGPAARSYLVTGLIAPGLTSLHLDTAHTASISPDAGLPDAVEKSLVVAGSRLLTFNEANGRGVNPAPQAHLFDLSLREQGTLPFPNLEYRLGDMTPPDDAGQFWATNYFFPLDRALAVDSDPLFELYPKGYTHSVWITVERLVQFQFGEFGIHLSDIPPIQLQLLDDNHPRQWEAIARLDGRGFLLATDRNPTTILGFVALP
ncbi:MAG TPA: hypothetical protein VF823_12400 [Anaerolineales bacterium]